jgi:hypothetical protein
MAIRKVVPSGPPKSPPRVVHDDREQRLNQTIAAFCDIARIVLWDHHASLVVRFHNFNTRHPTAPERTRRSIVDTSGVAHTAKETY